MGSNLSTTILTLGFVGVGGYLFVTQVWPMVKRQLEDSSIGGPTSYYDNDDERLIPPSIIYEDRIPDIVYEDRYPDIVYEDRYPDYYPYYPQQPYPYYPQYPPLPPTCPPGRYWNGDRCKKIDIDCPPGYREDDGVCKPRNCDRDEVWDGWTCRKIPRLPSSPRPRPRDRDRDRWRDNNNNNRRRGDNKPPERRFGNNRDKWNADREVEQKLKDIVKGEGGDTTSTSTSTPEKDRVREIAEKAVQSFIEIWEV